MRSDGLHESAIAIIARCRIPPENSCGYWSMRRSGFEMQPSARSSIARFHACFVASSPCACSCSSICQPIVYTGVNAVIGSWKIIAISPPRIARISPGERANRSRPRSRTWPCTMAFGSRISRITAIIETVLPEPDSPTIPTTSSTSTVSESPSTARRSPASVRNETWRSRTSSRGSGNAHPRVEPRVEQVDDCVRDHDEECGVDHCREDHRQIEVLQRVVRQLADPVEPEHDLGEERRAADERAEVQSEERDEADQRHA